jgi:hypothetical protein
MTDPRELWGLPAEVWDVTAELARAAGLSLEEAAVCISRVLVRGPLVDWLNAAPSEGEQP